MLGACASAASGGPTTAGFVDRTLSRFAYIGEGVGATVIVGTQAARYREDTPYMPVEIAVANTGDAVLRLSRASFTLVDDAGMRYSAVPPKPLLERYDFLDMDRAALSELTGIAAATFPAYRPVPSKFSPTRQVRAAGAFTRDVVLDEVLLPRSGYLVDFIYFDRPAAGIQGHRFELRVEAPSLTETIVVSFVVD